jgi:hypothetical protein
MQTKHSSGPGPLPQFQPGRLIEPAIFVTPYLKADINESRKTSDQDYKAKYFK